MWGRSTKNYHQAITHGQWKIRESCKQMEINSRTIAKQYSQIMGWKTLKTLNATAEKGKRRSHRGHILTKQKKIDNELHHVKSCVPEVKDYILSQFAHCFWFVYTSLGFINIMTLSFGFIIFFRIQESFSCSSCFDLLSVFNKIETSTFSTANTLTFLWLKSTLFNDA